MISTIQRIGEWSDDWDRSVREYRKATLYFWRVSYRNSKIRFVVQHLNLFLGFYIFFFLLPGKAEVYLMNFVASVYFSLPVIMQTWLSRVDVILASAPYISCRGVVSFFLAWFFNSICPTMPRTVFHSSLHDALIQLIGYLLLISIICIKQVCRVLWYYLSTLLSNVRRVCSIA